MPYPNFEISTPPGFEITEEPSQVGAGAGGLWAAPIAGSGGRWGVILAREPRPGVVRTMTVYSQELDRLLECLARL